MMAFVSKRELPGGVKEKLYAQLVDVFTAHEGKFDSKKLVYELFTPTERLMFAKRIAIVLLLEKGYTSYGIAQLLNVSDSTVSRLDVQRERGRFAHIARVLKNREHRHSFIGILETVLTLGLPGVASRKMHERIRKDIEYWRSGGT